jgi:hypothetical protein
LPIQKPKPRKKKPSDTDSLSSTASLDCKDKSKLWTPEEEEFFEILIKNYGTDFSIMSMFFPKKTKNQIKVILSPLRTSTNKNTKKIKNKPKSTTLNSKPSRLSSTKQTSTRKKADLAAALQQFNSPQTNESLYKFITLAILSSFKQHSILCHIPFNQHTCDASTGAKVWLFTTD